MRPKPITVNSGGCARRSCEGDHVGASPRRYQLVDWAMRDNLELPVYPFNVPTFREARFK
jgi:hypothetical protein